MSENINENSYEIKEKKSLEANNIDLAGETNNETLSVGKILKNKRIEKGFDLKAISKKLCIRAVYIENIENGDYKLLPGQAYAIGFIKSYSSFLGLNVSDTLSLYKKEIFNEGYNKITKRGLDDLGLSSIIAKIGLVCGSVIIALIIYFSWYALTIKGKGKVEEIVAEAVIETIVNEERKTVNVDELADSLLLESLEKVNLQNILSDEDFLQEESINKTNSKSKDKKGRIILKSTEDSWVKLSKGRETVYSGMLKKDESFNIPGVSRDEVIIMDTGNAGGIDIYVDRRLIGKAGLSGEVKRGVLLDPNTLISKKGL